MTYGLLCSHPLVMFSAALPPLNEAVSKLSRWPWLQEVAEINDTSWTLRFALPYAVDPVSLGHLHLIRLKQRLVQRGCGSLGS